MCSPGRQPLDLARHQDADETIYWADNDQYPPLDAWVLAAILRSVKPAPDDRGRLGILVADHRQGQP